MSDTTTAPAPHQRAKAVRRFVMSIFPDDEKDFEFIVRHYRREAGFEVKIAEIQRKLWKAEVARLKEIGVK